MFDYSEKYGQIIMTDGGQTTPGSVLAPTIHPCWNIISRHWSCDPETLSKLAAELQQLIVPCSTVSALGNHF